MSTTTEPDWDHREQLARIDRMIEEARKFAAEQHKLAAEQNKFAAEQNKLAAEQSKLSAKADKFRRERFLAPVLAVVATLGAIAALAPSILRSAGGH